jgi:uncharacterized protein
LTPSLWRTAQNVAIAVAVDHLRRLSTLVSAALKAESVPERALLRAEEVDVFALSAALDGEIAGVLNRPRFARAIPLARRERVLEMLRHSAIWFEPAVRVTDGRDPRDNKYLELAFAAGAKTIVSSDDDLLVLDPWRGVSIMRPADYLDFWRGRSGPSCPAGT